MSMTNEEIIKSIDKGEPWEYLSEQIVTHINNLPKALEQARADEREKMTQEKFAEYFNSLKGGEVASAILTQLLRRGVTDDDLRGMRLQWITDERAKTSEKGTNVWVSWDSEQNDTPPFIRGIDSNPYISSGGRPEPKDIGDGKIVWMLAGSSENFTKIDSDLAALLGVKPGECKAFFIKEANEND